MPENCKKNSGSLASQRQPTVQSGKQKNQEPLETSYLICYAFREYVFITTTYKGTGTVDEKNEAHMNSGLDTDHPDGEGREYY